MRTTDESNSTTSEVREHLARCLGEPDEHIQADDRALSVRELYRFHDAPHPGVDSFATWDLHCHPVEPSASAVDDLRYELIFGCQGRFSGPRIHQLLLSVANDLVRLNMAPVDGRVLDVNEPLVTGSACEGFLFYDPVLYAEELGLLEGSTFSLAVRWIVPITRAEMRFVEQHGFHAFEPLLIEQEPDVFDLGRPSISLLAHG